MEAEKIKREKIEALLKKAAIEKMINLYTGCVAARFDRRRKNPKEIVAAGISAEDIMRFVEKRHEPPISQYRADDYRRIILKCLEISSLPSRLTQIFEKML